MRSIDNDIKKLQDELTEVKNNYTQLVKKDGNTLTTKDISEVIYTANINPDMYFVEKHNSSFMSTVIAIVHKYVSLTIR
jgi:tRNA A58 N-methylase Trm61